MPGHRLAGIDALGIDGQVPGRRMSAEAPDDDYVSLRRIPR
jgi:hypothetical protein